MCRLQERLDLVELAAAAHEARDEEREVVGHCVECAKWRELALQAGDGQLEEGLVVGEVLQSMLAHVAQRCSLGDMTLHESRRRLRQDDLVAMAGRGDPRRPVHVQPDVVVASEGPLAGVDADPDLDRRARGPFVSLERFLHGDRRLHRLRSRLEDREEGIAFGLDRDAAVHVDGGAEDAVVVLQHLPPFIGGQVLDEARRSLDVGQEERDRSGGERRCHPLNSTTQVRRDTARGRKFPPVRRTPWRTVSPGRGVIGGIDEGEWR